MYCNLIQSYIIAFNSNTLPSINKAWDFIVNNECLASYNDCIDIYNKGLKEIFKEDISRSEF